MNTSTFNIGLFESENESHIINILKKIGCNIHQFRNIESSVDSIGRGKIDLVIYRNNGIGDTGIHAFKHLRPFLLKNGVPFIMYLELFDKEEILVGLELGVDNFICPPYDCDSIRFKLINEISKKSELDIFETEHFKNYYNSSLVSMFYVVSNRIKNANSAFYALFQLKEKEVLEQPLSSFYNITENEDNELKYRRFRSGIIDSCTLKNVSCLYNPHTLFDINFYRGNKMGLSSVFGEVVPSLHRVKQTDILTGMSQESKRFDEHKSITYENLDAFKLTEKEKNIFMLSLKGKAIKQIASDLNISHRTVEKHRSNIMNKTQTTNFIETISKMHFTIHGEMI